jgi:hypothetical protein
MQKLLRLAAVAFIAGTTITLTGAPVWAFSQQTLLPQGNYDFNYGPTDKYKSNDNANKDDPHSPGLHFSIQGGQNGPGGFRSFGREDNYGPPDFSRPIGNGN